MSQIYDLIVVGGGINGAGIARDAAGRGLSVLLCEMDDFASGTSSWSTKLIHGGLRYLEHYEFRLVREALTEREILWKIAPHIIQPLRLVLPHHAGLRPAWLLRFGLFIYDHLGSRDRLPATKTLQLARDQAGKALHRGAFSVGFEFSDCVVDDARLVVLNVRDAADRGATVRTRTEVISAKAIKGCWQVEMRDRITGKTSMALGSCLVNATGPWVGDTLAIAGIAAATSTRLVKGSHIVVPRMYEHDRAYLLQNVDGRVVFVIPYQDQYTLIGTTDQDFVGDPRCAEIDDDEVEYLCQTVNEYFSKSIGSQDIVWNYSGVRPLYGDGEADPKAVTRDYHLELSDVASAPCLSIFGGKLTTYRRLAEDALKRIGPLLEKDIAGQSWTSEQPLPGGGFEPTSLPQLATALKEKYPFLPQGMAARMVKSYGTKASAVLGSSQSLDDLGQSFGAGLYEREVLYLIEQEWARSADDVLWRRSKIGLRLSQGETAAVAAFMRASSHVDINLGSSEMANLEKT